jgi:hypothetical protein
MPAWQTSASTTGEDYDVDIESGEFPEEFLATMPEAPWTEAPVAPAAAPAELLAAWASAPNREWCAPLVPGGIDGATARRADYDGGWAVEFDKSGMPGVTRNGRACTNCGRGAFGIAGTAIMIDDEEQLEAEERILRDGSRVRYEPAVDEEDEEGGVATRVATIKIRGQECVYQVWSFAGDEHLETLIEDLRFVEARE